MKINSIAAGFSWFLQIQHIKKQNRFCDNRSGF